MDRSSQILKWVKSFFDQAEAEYELLEGKDVIRIIMPLDGKLKSSTIEILFWDDSYTVNAYIPLNADEYCRQRVAEYITRATYGLSVGNFEMDFLGGEIRYRLTLDCEDRTSLSDDLIRSTLAIPLGLIDKYGDGLVAVMYGFKSPEDAIKEIDYIFEETQETQNETDAVEIGTETIKEDYHMATASQILNMVKEFFDHIDLKYELLEGEDVIRIVMPLDGKLTQTTMDIVFVDGSYTVLAYIPLRADEDCQQRVAEYITRITYGLRYGNFEMDFRDGAIRYRLTLDCEDRTSLSYDLIMDTITIPRGSISTYGDGLVAVMYGVKSPEDAYKEVQNRV